MVFLYSKRVLLLSAMYSVQRNQIQSVWLSDVLMEERTLLGAVFHFGAKRHSRVPDKIQSKNSDYTLKR